MGHQADGSTRKVTQAETQGQRKNKAVNSKRTDSLRRKGDMGNIHMKALKVLFIVETSSAKIQLNLRGVGGR